MKAVNLGVRLCKSPIRHITNKRHVSIISMAKTRKIPADDDDTPRKRNGRRLCSVAECQNFILQAGVCRRHGAVIKRCSRDGCTNQAQNGGVCIRHGAKKTHKTCSHAGCTKYAQKRGFCCRHGGKYTCRFEGCANQIVKGGVCWSHGVKQRAQKSCSSSQEGVTLLGPLTKLSREVSVQSDEPATPEKEESSVE